MTVLKPLIELASSPFSMPLHELILDPESVKLTFNDILKSKFSHSLNKPISVWVGKDGLHLGDGYHRVIEALLSGKKTLKAIKDNRYSTEFTRKPWSIDRTSKTFGLESIGIPKSQIEQAKTLVKGKK